MIHKNNRHGVILLSSTRLLLIWVLETCCLPGVELYARGWGLSSDGQHHHRRCKVLPVVHIALVVKCLFKQDSVIKDGRPFLSTNLWSLDSFGMTQLSLSDFLDRQQIVFASVNSQRFVFWEGFPDQLAFFWIVLVVFLRPFSRIHLDIYTVRIWSTQWSVSR